MTQLCKSLQNAREGVDVPSLSSDSTYLCYAFRRDQLDACKCMAFVMARNRASQGKGTAKSTVATCKHLNWLRDMTCTWEAEPTDAHYYEECPKCGGKVVDTDEPSTAESTDVATALAELARELACGTAGGS